MELEAHRGTVVVQNLKQLSARRLQRSPSAGLSSKRKLYLMMELVNMAQQTFILSGLYVSDVFLCNQQDQTSPSLTMSAQ